MTINASFTRRVISYQDSKRTPGLRWFKYKEGFSTRLVREWLQHVEGSYVLDPFAGIGTTPLTAAGWGRCGLGIELMPVGILVANGISALTRWWHRRSFHRIAQALLRRVRQDWHEADAGYRFHHVQITRRAFPQETEGAIARANAFIAEEVEPELAPLLRLACMCVLEDVSYTRKDGQYLRWDHRSGRPLRARMEKGPIPRFADALEARLTDMERDMECLPDLFGGPLPAFATGSCLERLKDVETASQDAVVTSPPYANRYDYTRTYALELAYLGLDQDDFRTLRQALVSATVENKCKRDWLRQVYRNASLLHRAEAAYATTPALHEPLSILRARRRELSNPHVIRMVENYFLECAVVIAELGRVVRPGGSVFMVNDNVQYHGEEFPVDLVLSAFAEQLGFLCRHIWVPPRGKGNASQQMGRFGRREQRAQMCISLGACGVTKLDAVKRRPCTSCAACRSKLTDKPWLPYINEHIICNLNLWKIWRLTGLLGRMSRQPAWMPSGYSLIPSCCRNCPSVLALSWLERSVTQERLETGGQC